MAGKGFYSNPVAVSDVAGAILDPVLRRRTGMSVALVQSWEEIVGPRLAATSRPERIRWARRGDENDPYEPAVLVVACEGLAALHLQHQTGEVIGRINAFLGFAGIGRIRIVQKPVRAAVPVRPRLRALSGEEKAEVERTVSGIEDDGLRAALERLGASVKASRSPGKG